MEPEIRQATVHDAPELALLWLAMGAEKGLTDPDGDGWFRQEWEGIITGKVIAVVAIVDARVVAFADGALEYEPATRETALLGRHVFVEPASRGCDLAQKVMLELLALARQSGASYLLTHGTVAAHVFEKATGKPMELHASLKMGRV